MSKWKAAMNDEDWLKGVPKEITEDVLWTVKAYRYVLFLSDLRWFDVTRLRQDNLNDVPMPPG